LATKKAPGVKNYKLLRL